MKKIIELNPEQLAIVDNMRGDQSREEFMQSHIPLIFEGLDAIEILRNRVNDLEAMATAIDKTAAELDYLVRGSKGKTDD